MKHKQG